MQTQDRIIAETGSSTALRKLQEESKKGGPLKDALSQKNTREGLSVNRLVLTNFRNYPRCTLDLKERSSAQDADLVVLTGPNGSGKTNLLEALSYLSPGRGLRSAKLGEVTCLDGAGPWAVSAEISNIDSEGHDDIVKLGTGLEARPYTGENDGLEQEGPEDNEESISERRVVRIDGLNVSGPAALSDHMSVSWITPRMDRLFMEGTTIRRRFFDRMAASLHPNHGRQVAAYERAMRERIKLLSDPRGNVDQTWVGALEKKAAEFGVAVAASRLDTLGHLLHQINEQTVSAFPRADVALEGHLEDWLGSEPAVVVEDRFMAELAKNRQSDGRQGRAAFGPHKTDFTAFHVKKNMPAKLCSTGEQKALLMGIVLAGARMERSIMGRAPILLLDEVAAHLDKARRTALYEELKTLGSQVWLTGTDRDLFKSLSGEAVFFDVEKGLVTAQDHPKNPQDFDK